MKICYVNIKEWKAKKETPDRIELWVNRIGSIVLKFLQSRK